MENMDNFLAWLTAIGLLGITVIGMLLALFGITFGGII